MFKCQLWLGWISEFFLGFFGCILSYKILEIRTTVGVDQVIITVSNESEAGSSQSPSEWNQEETKRLSLCKLRYSPWIQSLFARMASRRTLHYVGINGVTNHGTWCDWILSNSIASDLVPIAPWQIPVMFGILSQLRPLDLEWLEKIFSFNPLHTVQYIPQ